jgi:ribosome-binding protein aMBF1 (putative translation factor)
MDRGLSEAFLGHCLNMDTSEIRKLEDGDIQPTDDLIDDIVIVLGLTRGGWEHQMLRSLKRGSQDLN